MSTAKASITRNIVANCLACDNPWLAYVEKSLEGIGLMNIFSGIAPCAVPGRKQDQAFTDRTVTS